MGKASWLRRLIGVVAVFLLLGSGYLAGSAQLFAPQHVTADDTCQTFNQTGKQVCGRFLEYWQTNGGLAQQGLPLSDAFQEKSDIDGKTYTVQYFERAVFEAHPENQRPYDVLLSLLGTEKFKAKYPNGPGASPAPAPTASTPGAYPRTANGQGFRLTVYEVKDPGPTGQYDFQKPKAGNRFIAVDLSITATVSEGISANRFYAKLKTDTNRDYMYGSSVPEPNLALGTVQPNETSRGWITFEIPIGERAISITYDPTFGKGPATIDLR